MYYLTTFNIGISFYSILSFFQHYIDCLGGGHDAEDSSYDSEGDLDDASQQHQNVSRTVSDTLGQEFAEYVSTNLGDRPPGYTARVEFALKLGYTERLVQAALARLGPCPTQNELLAELIKLGAQCPKNSSETTDCGESTPRVTTEVGLSTHSVSEERLRPVVVDGSNVAMSHGNKEVFSCRGIRLCVDWFRARGHRDITVFVPKWRKESPRVDNPIKEQELLGELERERALVFTPSRLVGGKRMVCYDDRYILKLAAENNGVVVSNDNYRDLAQESPEFRKVIEERILMYSFVNDRFMPPDDPLGRSGPTLDHFLKIQPRKGDSQPPCPYGKKCTYGNKCKFYHPERGSLPHKSVTERLSEHAARHLQARRDPSPVRRVQGKSLSLPITNDGDNRQSSRKTPLGRTQSIAPELVYTEPDSYPKSESSSVGFSNAYYNETSAFRQLAPPKSHSIENISGEYNVGYALWGPSKEVEADSTNLHRKLQRQLTLNPGCDPRLYRMQNNSVSTSSNNSNCGSHRALGPTLSGPQQFSHWDMTKLQPHQNVTRIASAPDSSRPWHATSSAGPASTSEPQINLWPPRGPTHALDTRRGLHYHLASIFPEEQVQAAMRLYPDETNPQKICAAILSMFSK